MARRTITPLASLIILFAFARPAVAQVVAGNSIQGDWVRVVSNNNPNDQMRIQINGDGVLTSVPAAASGSWKVGQVLWRGIQTDGTLQVRGSDGQYYAAQLSMKSPDEIRLAIHLRTAGDDQTWRRAGPSIDGDWVQVSPSGTTAGGLRVQVQSQQGAIRYLPPAAPRSMRVGSRLWQNIGPRGSLDVLGSDRQYHTATYTLVNPNTLQVDATGVAGGPGQIWVRPGTTPPATPAAPAAAPACFATSMPHDRPGLRWGLGMYSASNDPARSEVVGIRDYMASGLPTPWIGNNVPTDIEYARFPGLQRGVAWVWDRGGSRRVFRDQTSAELGQRMQAARPAGERPVDFEAQSATSGMRYSTIWESNTEGIDWEIEYDLTGATYGTEFQSRRSAGYRLIDMEAYQTPAGLRYAAIWWKSCDNGNWKQVRDMSRQAYQSRVTAESAQGFQVTDFESYVTPSGQRYAAIWERIPADRGWAVRTDRDLNGFLNWHRRYEDEGMRLLDFEAYDTPQGATRYAGVWVENEARYDFPFKADVDAAIADYRETRGIPGVSVVVMQDDEVIYRRGFGWADSVERKEAHSGTVYITASISKAIGGTIAARLEERGIIDLTARTRSFLPNLPAGHTHTLEQLLAKTGCFRHYAEISRSARPDTTRVYAWQVDAAARIWKDPLLPNCTPGTRYHYSTHGYTVLGAALEEVTGKPIRDLLRDEITSPFNLPSMEPVVSGRWGGFGALGVRPYHLARAYRRHATKWGWRDAVNYENATWKALGGGLQTNARDLARFGWLTLDGQIVSPTTRDTRLWRPLTSGTTRWSDGGRSTTTALAWVVTGRGPRVRTSSGSRNRMVAEHGGTGRGGKTLLRIYRSEGLTISILTNQRQDLSARTGDHAPGGLATTVANLVFQNPPPP